VGKVYLQKLKDSLEQIEELLKSDDGGTDQQLSARSQTTLLFLRDQTAACLSGLIDTITEKILLLKVNFAENQTQDDVTAYFILIEYQMIDAYLNEEFPKVKEASEKLDERLEASKDSVHESLRGVLAKLLQDIKAAVDEKLADLE
ncbi:hypothetical protein CRM22_011160, partial [Opisthorchis felineus]